METVAGDSPDTPVGADPDDAAEDVSDRQENLGTDPAVLALIEGLKGPKTSVQVMTTNGWSLPVMDPNVAKSCLVFIPDRIDKEKIMDFTSIHLASLIPAEQIQNRWLNRMVPMPDHVMKAYPPNITSLLHQILKSYAGTAIRGRGVLPFVHPLQTADYEWNEPLSTCLSAVRILDNPILGPEKTTVNLIRSAMSNIEKEYLSYSAMGALAAFQAYLIYTLTLFFYVEQDRDDYLANAMVILQALARHVTLQGLVVRSKASNCRPIWEEWVAAEAKRRTILVMYLFDTLLAIGYELPTYLMVELQGLPAPGPKSLWQARVRTDWKLANTACETHWDNGAYLRIFELWPPPQTLDAFDAQRRRNRVDLWLEDVDEFGTFFYAFMASTHGQGIPQELS